MKEEFMHQMKLKLGYISCAIISVQDRQTFRPPPPTRVEPYATNTASRCVRPAILYHSPLPRFDFKMSAVEPKSKLYFSQIRKKEARRRRKIQNNKIHF